MIHGGRDRARRARLCFAAQPHANVSMSRPNTRSLPMSFRIRMIITAAWLCHYILAPQLLTSQLLSAPNRSAQDSPSHFPSVSSAPANGEEARVEAITQEKVGNLYKLHGDAKIFFRTYVLQADEISFDQQTNEATAEGHMLLEGGPSDEHIEASRGSYNIRMETGRFYNVTGTIGLKLIRTRYVLTSSSPIAFTGKVVEKTGPERYVVSDGTVTTCELPHPKWEFEARRVVVELGANAKIYRSTFKLHGIPVFYFPFVTHPVEKQARQSGFLIPSVGQSSRKGFIVGDSAYWAINRSMDATVGGEYYSLRGSSQRGEFRARPSDTSFLDLNYFGVVDRGIGSPPAKQGGENVRLNAESRFWGGFRGVADIDYLSSFVFRLAFNEVFSQAVNSEVKSWAFLSKTTNGFSYNAAVERYQNFESTQKGDVVTILHAPSIDVSSVEREIGHTPLFWSFNGAGEGLSRSEPGFRTANLLGRFDISPMFSLPLHWRGWSLRSEMGLRDTYYTQSFVPAPATTTGIGTASDQGINRRSLSTSVEMRPPALAKVFDHEVLGRKWKHVIEPRVVYRFATGVDNFRELLRFDDRDILSNTNEVEYGIVQRLYGKQVRSKPEDCGVQGIQSLTIGRPARTSPVPWERGLVAENEPCGVEQRTRQVLTWELSQKYFLDPTFGGALISGQRNVFTTTADFTGIAFLTSPRHLSPLVSKLRFDVNSRTNAEWELDYDLKNGRIDASTVLANFRAGPFTFGGGDTFLKLAGESFVSIPPTITVQQFHQFRFLFGYGEPNRRGFSGASSFGFDVAEGFLQYASVQTSYNWDCCGFSVEYRRFALGSVRNENQYRFAFTLANVGSFGNLRRQERLY